MYDTLFLLSIRNVNGWMTVTTDRVALRVMYLLIQTNIFEHICSVRHIRIPATIRLQATQIRRIKFKKMKNVCIVLKQIVEQDVGQYVPPQIRC
jgi:hypothetical protein